jgi:hypothetical protein
MITPREMLRDYMTVLNILMQNEKVTFEQIMVRNAESEPEPVAESEDEISAPKKTFSVADIEF